MPSLGLLLNRLGLLFWLLSFSKRLNWGAKSLGVRVAFLGVLSPLGFALVGLGRRRTLLLLEFVLVDRSLKSKGGGLRLRLSSLVLGLVVN